MLNSLCSFPLRACIEVYIESVSFNLTTAACRSLKIFEVHSLRLCNCRAFGCTASVSGLHFGLTFGAIKVNMLHLLHAKHSHSRPLNK